MTDKLITNIPPIYEVQTYENEKIQLPKSSDITDENGKVTLPKWLREESVWWRCFSLWQYQF